MHIFLVNDDGIGSTGIMALARAALSRGHRVSMCAPATQQSAASQRITLADPIYVSDWPTEDENFTAYAIKGSPTDCVRLGLLHMVKEPVDVLISGINDGYNAGMAVHYSGTVGAAQEGALNHLHAIATSIHYHATAEMLANLADFTIATAEKYVTMTLPAGVILNINAPLVEPAALKAPVIAPLSTANFTDSYDRRESPRAGTYFWLNGGSSTEPPTPGSDHALLNEGHITLTFMGNPSDHGAQFADFALTCQTDKQKV